MKTKKKKEKERREWHTYSYMRISNLYTLVDTMTVSTLHLMIGMKRQDLLVKINRIIFDDID